jgi:hypothetical protein
MKATYYYHYWKTDAAFGTDWTHATDSELIRSAQLLLHPGDTLARELVRRLEASVALQALLAEAPGVDWTDLADVQCVSKLVRVLDKHNLRDPDDLDATLVYRALFLAAKLTQRNNKEIKK